MKIVVYGLTVTSSWGNGHATTYRSLLKALTARGHTIHFVEKDVEWYRHNRDLPEPSFCTVHLYESWAIANHALTLLASDADVVVVGSYFPDAIATTEALIQQAASPVFFYDIDTPITLANLRSTGATEYLTAASIPVYDAYLSFTGGPALLELQQTFGAHRAIAFFCSVDPDLYRPSPEHTEYRCDLSYLGTYAPDRQPKLMHLLNNTAGHLENQHFLVAGPQYPADTLWNPNVKRITHVAPPEHPAFYSSARFTLNLTRNDMINAGYSPSVRLFEASACGATIMSDSWPGLQDFLRPEEEVLLPADAYDVTKILTGMPDEERRKIGARARERILSEHTATQRAIQFEEIVSECKD